MYIFDEYRPICCVYRTLTKIWPNFFYFYRYRYNERGLFCPPPPLSHQEVIDAS